MAGSGEVTFGETERALGIRASPEPWHGVATQGRSLTVTAWSSICMILCRQRDLTLETLARYWRWALNRMKAASCENRKRQEPPGPGIGFRYHMALHAAGGSIADFGGRSSQMKPSALE
eukprot:s3795_g4.t1